MRFAEPFAKPPVGENRTVSVHELLPTIFPLVEPGAQPQVLLTRLNCVPATDKPPVAARRASSPPELVRVRTAVDDVPVFTFPKDWGFGVI